MTPTAEATMTRRGTNDWRLVIVASGHWRDSRDCRPQDWKVRPEGSVVQLDTLPPVQEDGASSPRA